MFSRISQAAFGSLLAAAGLLLLPHTLRCQTQAHTADSEAAVAQTEDKCADQCQRHFARLSQEQESELAARLQRMASAFQQRAARLAQINSGEAQARLAAGGAALQARAAKTAVLAQQIAQNEDEVWGDHTGWLGVDIDDISAKRSEELKLSSPRGVVVNEVEEDSPAGKAGIKNNDVILSYNGQQVEGSVQFRRLVRETPPGRTVPVVIWREGHSQTVSLQVGDRAGSMESSFRVLEHMPRAFNFNFDNMPNEMFLWAEHAPLLGISVEDLSRQLGAYFGAPDDAGVLVSEVRPGTPAEKAGLKAGDIITRLDDTRTKSASELQQQLEAKRQQKSVAITVIRRGKEMKLNIELEHPRPPEAPQVTRQLSL